MADQRTVALVDEFFGQVRDFVVRHDLGYAEYAAVMKYLIDLGTAGEWPLFLDAFFESTVNTQDYGTGPWTPSTITGPYYKAGAPMLEGRPATLPMRESEPGEPILFKTTITDPAGVAIEGAIVDVWQATDDGIYSFFSDRMPEDYLLRGRISSDADGGVEFRSIKPVPYEIPKDGPVGRLMIDVLGRHSWRPAHLHFLVTADGYAPLITQLYFEGDPYIDSDSCSGVKDDLVVKPTKILDGDHEVSYIEFPFVLQPSESHTHGGVPQAAAPATI